MSCDELIEGITGLPFEFVSESPSTTLTSLYPVNTGAKEIVRILMDDYQIWVCPNGGEKAVRYLDLDI